jgi:TrmH family RNA methyltransferase
MPSLEAKSQLITSRNHPMVRRLRGLHARAERDRTGLFLIEGVRFLANAVQRRAKIDTLLVAPELLNNPFGKKLVRQLARSGTRCLDVTPEVLHSAAQTDDPQGVVAAVRQEWTTLSETPPDDGLCWLAVSTVQSSGNLGSLMRTSDAVGASGVLFLTDGPDPYDPAAVRASMGSVFALRYARVSVGELMAWKRRHECELVGTSPAAELDYQEHRYRRPGILFLGWERRGLSAEEQALCDVMVRIPMAGRCDSLNLAIAASVMLYEVFNQHRRLPAGVEGAL